MSTKKRTPMAARGRNPYGGDVRQVNKVNTNAGTHTHTCKDAQSMCIAHTHTHTLHTNLLVSKLAA